MAQFTAKQRASLGKKIREGKDRLFPGRGGCGRLAERLGVSPQVLSHWMGGSRIPDPEQLAALAKLFGVSILELCSLPKIKRSKGPPSVYDVIAEVTNNRKAAGASQKKRQQFGKIESGIKSFIEKEIKDLPS